MPYELRKSTVLKRKRTPSSSKIPIPSASVSTRTRTRKATTTTIKRNLRTSYAVPEESDDEYDEYEQQESRKKRSRHDTEPTPPPPGAWPEDPQNEEDSGNGEGVENPPKTAVQRPELPYSPFISHPYGLPETEDEEGDGSSQESSPQTPRPNTEEYLNPSRTRRIIPPQGGNAPPVPAASAAPVALAAPAAPVATAASVVVPPVPIPPAAPAIPPAPSPPSGSKRKRADENPLNPDKNKAQVKGEPPRKKVRTLQKNRKKTERPPYSASQSRTTRGPGSWHDPSPLSKDKNKKKGKNEDGGEDTDNDDEDGNEAGGNKRTRKDDDGGGDEKDKGNNDGRGEGGQGGSGSGKQDGDAGDAGDEERDEKNAKDGESGENGKDKDKDENKDEKNEKERKEEKEEEKEEDKEGENEEDDLPDYVSSDASDAPPGPSARQRHEDYIRSLRHPNPLPDPDDNTNDSDQPENIPSPPDPTPPAPPIPPPAPSPASEAEAAQLINDVLAGRRPRRRPPLEEDNDNVPRPSWQDNPRPRLPVITVLPRARSAPSPQASTNAPPTTTSGNTNAGAATNAPPTTTGGNTNIGTAPTPTVGPGNPTTTNTTGNVAPGPPEGNTTANPTGSGSNASLPISQQDTPQISFATGSGSSTDNLPISQQNTPHISFEEPTQPPPPPPQNIPPNPQQQQQPQQPPPAEEFDPTISFQSCTTEADEGAVPSGGDGAGRGQIQGFPAQNYQGPPRNPHHSGTENRYQGPATRHENAPSVLSEGDPSTSGWDIQPAHATGVGGGRVDPAYPRTRDAPFVVRPDESSSFGREIARGESPEARLGPDYSNPLWWLNDQQGTGQQGVQAAPTNIQNQAQQGGVAAPTNTQAPGEQGVVAASGNNQASDQPSPTQDTTAAESTETSGESAGDLGNIGPQQPVQPSTEEAEYIPESGPQVAAAPTLTTGSGHGATALTQSGQSAPNPGGLPSSSGTSSIPPSSQNINPTSTEAVTGHSPSTTQTPTATTASPAISEAVPSVSASTSTTPTRLAPPQEENLLWWQEIDLENAINDSIMDEEIRKGRLEAEARIRAAAASLQPPGYTRHGSRSTPRRRISRPRTPSELEKEEQEAIEKAKEESIRDEERRRQEANRPLLPPRLRPLGEGRLGVFGRPLLSPSHNDHPGRGQTNEEELEGHHSPPMGPGPSNWHERRNRPQRPTTRGGRSAPMTGQGRAPASPSERQEPRNQPRSFPTGSSHAPSSGSQAPENPQTLEDPSSSRHISAEESSNQPEKTSNQPSTASNQPGAASNQPPPAPSQATTEPIPSGPPSFTPSQAPTEPVLSGPPSFTSSQAPTEQMSSRPRGPPDDDPGGTVDEPEDPNGPKVRDFGWPESDPLHRTVKGHRQKDLPHTRDSLYVLKLRRDKIVWKQGKAIAGEAIDRKRIFFERIYEQLGRPLPPILRAQWELDWDELVERYHADQDAHEAAVLAESARLEEEAEKRRERAAALVAARAERRARTRSEAGRILPSVDGDVLEPQHAARSVDQRRTVADTIDDCMNIVRRDHIAGRTRGGRSFSDDEMTFNYEETMRRKFEKDKEKYKKEQKEQKEKKEKEEKEHKEREEKEKQAK